MVETTAHLVDQVIPRVPVRQWVVSFPIPLRILFAAHPELLTPLLRIVHRTITGFLLKRTGLKRGAADTGAVTLIQRFWLGRQLEYPSALPGARRGVSAHRGRTHLR
jgi:hypothetical protein